MLVRIGDQRLDHPPELTDKPTPAVAAALLEELHRQPTIARMALTARRLLPHRQALASTPLRLGCLSSFTFDPLRTALELQGLRAGLAIETYLAPFGQFDQEMINPASGLSTFGPQAVILAIRLQDVCPAIYDAFNGLNGDAARRLVEDWIERLRCALLAFRRRSAAHLLIQNYDAPACPAMGIADRGQPGSQLHLINEANRKLEQMASTIADVWVMDYDRLVAAIGRTIWTDPRMELYARIPVAPANYWSLAGFYVRHLRPLFGLTKKVIALDADNTLWGGVVGDVGVGGIALGPDFPGNAYVAFQKKLLDLHHRGVVLCLASKNEPGIVEEVLDRHSAMVLRREHFAAMRINWRPKPDNLREMAADLNLGLDSFVFLDDSPVECEMMRTALPQVFSACLPAEPAALPAFVDSLDCFDQWTISAEDRQRGRMYRAEAGRRELQAAAVDLPSFYRELRMRMSLTLNDPTMVSRAAQLTQRTNQFNMNTVRCSEDDIRRFMADKRFRVVSLALADRFGDNGVVGLAVLCAEPREWTIQMLLMSCRILGRTVEDSFIKWIAAQARSAGAERLVGLFRLTAKNRPFAGFYAACGFTRAGNDGDVERWILQLAQAETRTPDWILLEVSEHGRDALAEPPS